MKIVVDKNIKDKVINKKSERLLKKKFGSKPDKIITVPKDKRNV